MYGNEGVTARDAKVLSSHVTHQYDFHSTFQNNTTRYDATFISVLMHRL